MRAKQKSYTQKAKELRAYGVKLKSGKLTRGKKSQISLWFNKKERLEGIRKKDGNFKLKKVRIPKGQKISGFAGRVGDFVFVPAHRSAKVRINRSGNIIIRDSSGRKEAIYWFTALDRKDDPLLVWERAKDAVVPMDSRILQTRMIMKGGWESNTPYKGGTGFNYFVTGSASGKGGIQRKWGKKGGKYNDWQDFRRQQVAGLKFTYV